MTFEIPENITLQYRNALTGAGASVGWLHELDKAASLAVLEAGAEILEDFISAKKGKGDRRAGNTHIVDLVHIVSVSNNPEVVRFVGKNAQELLSTGLSVADLTRIGQEARSVEALQEVVRLKNAFKNAQVKSNDIRDIAIYSTSKKDVSNFLDSITELREAKEAVNDAQAALRTQVEKLKSSKNEQSQEGEAVGAVAEKEPKKRGKS